MTNLQNDQNNPMGLFPLSYRISNNLAGGISFNLSLLVYTPLRRLTGAGSIFQAVNPPLNIITHLKGDYSYMCVMPKNCKILLVLQGVDEDGKLNVKLRIVLEENWETGYASYEFIRDGKWELVENVKVESVPHQDISELKKTTALSYQ